MKKPSEFPQGTQRIARINELCEPNTYVLEPAPAPVPEESAAMVEGTNEGALGDAELASSVNTAPVAVQRAKRATNAYTTEIKIERPILTVA